MPLNGQINTEAGETKDPKEHDRNGEVRKEFDPIAAEADKADADRAAGERQDDETQRKQRKP